MNIFPSETEHKLGFDAVRSAAEAFAESFLGKENVAGLRPFSEVSAVNEALNQTREMTRLLEEGSLGLHVVADEQAALRNSRIEHAWISGLSLSRIAESLAAFRSLRKRMSRLRDELIFLWSLAERLGDFSFLETEIRRVVDEHGEVKDGASQALAHIRKQLRAKHSELRSKVQQAMAQAKKDGMTAEEEPTLRNGRMVIPLKAEHKRHIAGFVHDISSTKQTVYLEPTAALHINNDIRVLENEERREVERILKEVTAIVGQYADAILQDYFIIGELDTIQAKARLSLHLEACFPLVNTDNSWDLALARNPILALRRQRGDFTDPIVPLSLQLSSSNRVLMITGPNAGGKSVAMKTLGLLVMMTQSGFGIPAKEGARLPVFSQLFVDLGDDQNIEQDLSTFSSRLAWIRYVSPRLNKSTLILIDEAASGTDPEEGSAIYQSFLEQVLLAKAQAVATTHHGSLKVFAHNTEGALNAAMEFDQSNLAPTYRLLLGQPGSSFAFDIARRMGVQKSLLDRARSILGDSKNNLETLITELETERQDVERYRLETETQLRKAKAQVREYEQRAATLNREREKIRAKAVREAEHIIKDANKRVERTIRELREAEAGKEAIKKAKEDVSIYEQELGKLNERFEQKELARAERQDGDLRGKPKIGDWVRLRGGQSAGELVELKGAKAVVQVDGLSLNTDIKKLVRVHPPKRKIRGIHFQADTAPVPVGGLNTRLDLRGRRGEDAIKELEHYLDRAVQNGLSKVDIIHGKGEGILSKLVHQYLMKRDHVSHFDFAPADQGGHGCTMVELGS